MMRGMGRITIGALLATLWLAAPASADSTDDQYISSLAAQGVSADRDTLIADGHAACDSYGSPGVTGVMLSIMGQGLSNTQAAAVIQTAWHTYCGH